MPSSRQRPVADPARPRDARTGASPATSNTMMVGSPVPGRRRRRSVAAPSLRQQVVATSRVGPPGRRGRPAYQRRQQRQHPRCRRNVKPTSDPAKAGSEPIQRRKTVSDGSRTYCRLHDRTSKRRAKAQQASTARRIATAVSSLHQLELVAATNGVSVVRRRWQRGHCGSESQKRGGGGGRRAVVPVPPSSLAFRAASGRGRPASTRRTNRR